MSTTEASAASRRDRRRTRGHARPPTRRDRAVLESSAACGATRRGHGSLGALHDRMPTPTLLSQMHPDDDEMKKRVKRKVSSKPSLWSLDDHNDPFGTVGASTVRVLDLAR